MFIKNTAEKLSTVQRESNEKVRKAYFQIKQRLGLSRLIRVSLKWQTFERML